MSDSERMLRASHNMSGAAEQMQHVANQMSDSFYQLGITLTNSIQELREIMDRFEKVSGAKKAESES